MSKSVLAVGQVFDEAPLRPVAAARVLVDDRIAMLGKIRGDIGARGGGGFAAVISLRLVSVAAVRRAFHDDREGAAAIGQMHVGGETNAVAHRNHVGDSFHYDAPKRRVSTPKSSVMDWSPVPPVRC